MSSHATTPHTRVDNTIIDKVADTIGIYGLGIYLALKRHLNQKTGGCFPSYRTIARKLGIDRGTVIRYVKKLKEFNLVDPEWRFKEDGSHDSNQYNFQQDGSCAPSRKNEEELNSEQGGLREPPPLVASDNYPGRPERPEQSESNKKMRTIAEVDLMPTEKQKTCIHPVELIVILPDDITICNHCYGLLDENFKLVIEEKPAEIVEAA